MNRKTPLALLSACLVFAVVNSASAVLRPPFPAKPAPPRDAPAYVVIVVDDSTAVRAFRHR